MNESFRPHRASDRPGRGPAGWFVTFGDLLTLLLAFFVVTISQNARTARSPASETESAQVVAADPDHLARQDSRRAEPGTLIAESDEGSADVRAMRDVAGRPYAEVIMVEGELLDLGRSPGSLEDRFAGQGVSTAHEFEVRVCGGSSDPLAWGQAERVAQIVVRQLSDATKDVPVRVQVLGPHCESLARPPYREVRAQLRMYG